jgi:hypothetical protein
MQHYNFERKRLNDGAVDLICARYSISHETLKRYLKDYHEHIDNEELYPNLESKKPGHCGVHCVLTPEIAQNLTDLHFMTEGNLPIDQFCELYEMEFDQHMCRHTMDKYLNEIGCKSIMTYVKPSLSPKQRLARLKFILRLISGDGHGHYQFIVEFRFHVDEKWFYEVAIRQKKRKFECETVGKSETVQHKSHIAKTMFLATIGRPELFVMEDGSVFPFDGKISIIPFVRDSFAARSSVNRPAGTPTLEDVSVTAEVFMEVMQDVGGVFDSIKKELPFLKGERIVVQVDGAKAHTGEDNIRRLNEMGQEDGWNIVVEVQPSQSPEFNRLDLCLFHSLNTESNKIKGQRKVD